MSAKTGAETNATPAGYCRECNGTGRDHRVTLPNRYGDDGGHPVWCWRCEGSGEDHHAH